MNNYNRYTFKAKRKDNGEWVYGYYVLYQGEHLIENDNNVDGIIINKETLCQCTGLQDIEGNYIFENDIVLITMKDIVKEKGKWITKIIYEENIVCWNEKESGFRFKDKDGIDWIGTDNEVKIIGNKFDKEVE